MCPNSISFFVADILILGWLSPFPNPGIHLTTMCEFSLRVVEGIMWGMPEPYCNIPWKLMIDGKSCLVRINQQIFRVDITVEIQAHTWIDQSLNCKACHHHWFTGKKCKLVYLWGTQLPSGHLAWSPFADEWPVKNCGFGPLLLFRRCAAVLLCLHFLRRSFPVDGVEFR